MYNPLEGILSAESVQRPNLTIGELRLELLLHYLMTIRAKRVMNTLV
jgi:hypothetical protein